MSRHPRKQKPAAAEAAPAQAGAPGPGASGEPSAFEEMELLYRLLAQKVEFYREFRELDQETRDYLLSPDDAATLEKGSMSILKLAEDAYEEAGRPPCPDRDEVLRNLNLLFGEGPAH